MKQYILSCDYFGKANVLRFLMTDNDMTFSVYPYSTHCNAMKHGIHVSRGAYAPPNAYVHITQKHQDNFPENIN